MPDTGCQMPDRRPPTAPPRDHALRSKHRVSGALLLVALALRASAVEPSRIVAAEGRGYLEQVGGQLILHVAGTPYEMGWQHGRLLRETVRGIGDGVKKRDVPARRLRATEDQFRRAAPPDLWAEACGVADGAGASRPHFLSAVSLSTVFSDGLSSTVAAWGRATTGGHAHHAHAAADTFGALLMQVRIRPVVLVAEPADGLPCVCLTRAGSLLAQTGMNAAGIAVSLVPTDQRFLDRPGWPASLEQGLRFDVRRVLCRAGSLDEAVAAVRAAMGKRRFCCVVSGPEDAVVLEGRDGRVEVLRPGDPASNTPPHIAVPDVLRRTGHFVHPAIAPGAREGLHPVYESPASWGRYWLLTDGIGRRYGRLDAAGLLRLGLEPRTFFGTCQTVVWSPTQQAFWWAPGSSRTSYVACRLSLPALLARRRVPMTADEIYRRGHAQTGICACDDSLRPLTDPDPAVAKLLEGYNVPADPFPWRTRHLESTEKYDVHHLTFPSPRRYDMLACNTVHAEYYEPRGIVPQGSIAQGRAWEPRPALIVLHILDGRFLVARMVCRELAKMKIPCLMVQMPYYGDRRPPGKGLADVMLERPERMFEAMEAAVPDIRRAASWLQARPEVDADRLGVLGVSLGAITGALVAGVDPRFNRNVLVIGGGDPATLVWSAPETRIVRRHLEQSGYSRDSLAKAIEAVDPLTFAHRVTTSQVLMINATHDKTIPKRCTTALWQAMGKPAIRWHAGGHYSMGLYTPLILSDAYNFITRLPADASWRQRGR